MKNAIVAAVAAATLLAAPANGMAAQEKQAACTGDLLMALLKPGQCAPAQTTAKKQVKVTKELKTQTRTSGYATPEKTVKVKDKGSYSGLISSYASAYGVPYGLAKAVVRVESNFRPNARGAAGEIGLMQLKLSTARMMGYSGSAKGLYHPETNIKYGMKYLAKAHKLGGGSTCGTILKYNAGHGAKRMNPVSANYCAKVKRYMGS